MTDSTDREWDYLKERVLPRRTRGRSRFLSNPARASRLSSGGSCAANPAPPRAPTFATRARRTTRVATRTRDVATTRSPTTATARASTQSPARSWTRPKPDAPSARSCADRKASHRAPPRPPRGRSASSDPARRDDPFARTPSSGRASPSRRTRDPPRAITSFPRSTARDDWWSRARGEKTRAHRTTREGKTRGAASGPG